jgi:TorA maturation chaperone TorD
MAEVTTQHPTAPPVAEHVDLIRALAVLGEPPVRESAQMADAVGLGSLPTGTEYSDLFLFQLYPYASVHVGPEGMLGGPARDRVAGFWRALGQTPPAEPDHLSALLGLYASVVDQAASAEGAEAALLEEGRVALLHEHLTPWVFFFLRRVAHMADPFYTRWAELLGDVLAREVRRGPAAVELPVHLRDAPELPDPRTEGGEAFLTGLLAPVRSGLILTRGDLTRLGRLLELGLRVGERRYVLEHLMGQEPVSVLRALRDEASARARHHDDAEPLLGVVATFWAGRARRSAELLDALAAEGSEALATAAHGQP